MLGRRKCTHNIFAPNGSELHTMAPSHLFKKWDGDVSVDGASPTGRQVLRLDYEYKAKTRTTQKVGCGGACTFGCRGFAIVVSGAEGGGNFVIISSPRRLAPQKDPLFRDEGVILAVGEQMPGGGLRLLSLTVKQQSCMSPVEPRTAPAFSKREGYFRLKRTEPFFLASLRD